MKYQNCECDLFESGKHNHADAVEIRGLAATSMNVITRKPRDRDPVTTFANGSLTASPTEGNAGGQCNLADGQSISRVSQEDADNLVVNEEVLQEVADLCHCAMEDLEDVYPCTPLQEGMMALTFKDSTAYTVEYEYRLPPGTDLKQLEAAWQKTAQACPILRTRIVPTSKRGCLQAVVRAPIHWGLQEDDDGTRSPTDSIDWRTGAPLAYFIVNSIRSVLTVVIHHAICDDWSMALLLRQVDAFYHGERIPSHPFRPLIKYVRESRARAELFWQDELRDAHESSMKTFPVQPTAGYVARPEGRLLKTFTVYPESGADFTVNTKMRLAWALLQSFYTGSHDNLFGAINAGRGVPVPGIQDLCGPAITSVPVRIQLSPEHTVTEALAAAQHQWVAAMEFEHVGLQALRHLGPGPAAACQFQTLLAVEPREAHDIPRLFSQHRSIQRTYDLYPLILRCRPTVETVEIEARFDPTVIENVQVERILHQLAHIYAQMEQRRYLTLRDIDPLCPEDRAQISRWNQTVEPSPASRPCVHHLIHDRTQTQPQATAISSWDGELSYQDLDDLSSAFASKLSLHGIGPSVFVPLLVEKSKWRAVAMLAVMKAGGAFALFDTSFPIPRLQRMSSQLNANLVIASEQHAQLASQLAAQVLIIDQSNMKQAILVIGHCPLHQPTVTPDDPVYVTFTSGSTGTPKGAVVHHAGYASSSLAHGHPYHFTPRSRVLQFASPAFDSCIIEHISTLIAGGCVCIPSSDDCQSNLVQAMKRFEVDVACLTPTVARILTPGDLPCLKHMVFVGEAVLESDITHWNAYVEVSNAYGPAECSAVFSVQPCLQPQDPGNIGFPTGGAGWVVDPEDHRRLMPLGCTGELVIEGPIVGLGYLSNPEQAAQVFIEPPPWRHQFGATSCGHFYKTGDLVKRRGNGSFSYVGRKDTQVKLHGQRLELTDVEHHLRAAFPQAQQAVAELLRFDSRGGRPDAVLTALVYIPSQIPLESKEGKPWLPPSEWFRSACTAAESRMLESMPRFMVPTIFLPLSYVPVTASGKTDRRKLREQATALKWDEMQAYRPAAAQLKSPTTTKEEILRSIWAKTLNRPVDGVGVTDSFFRLGGDSISAMQVATSCRAAGFAVTVADIFQCPTITKLAQKIQKFNSSQLLATDLEDQTDTWFSLSPIQRLFFEHAPNGHNQFTQQFLLRVAKPHTDSQLQEAVRMTVNRHSMLRARFQQQPNGQWSQSFSKDVTDCFRFQEHRLASIKYQGGMQSILSHSRKLLDIRKGVMLVIDLIHTASGEMYISLMAHHLVVDLVSWRVILQDIEDILSTGSPLQQPTMPFQRWCQLQEAYCKGSRNPKQTTLMDTPTPPSGYWGAGIFRNGNTWDCAVQEGITLPEHSTQAILGPANDAFHTRPVEIIHAAILGAFVEVFSDRSAPAIFSEGHGREPWNSDIDVSRTVGWFTTMVPLFVDAKKGQDITEVLKCTKDARRAIPSNGWASFTSRYLHQDGAEHSESHSPIELLFNYTGLFQQLERPNAHLQLAAVPDHDILPMPGDLPRFALIDVSATVMSGCLNLVFLYNRCSEHQTRLKQWMQACRRILVDLPRILQRLQRRTLSDFPLLSLAGDEELQRLLHHISCKFNLSLSEIEDIYPCSPIQLGMWLSQMRKPNMYWSRMRWELSPSHSASIPVDLTRVKRTWQQVVDRHTILRTVFTNGTSERNHPVQVVLRSVQADIEVLTKPSQSAQGCFQPHGGESQKLNLGPPHRLALWSKPHGVVCCELNINHMLMDGITGQILLGDFLQAYNGQLPSVSRGSYRSYITYLQGIETEGANSYWKEHLEGVNSCLLPSFGIPFGGVDSHTIRSVPYDFGTGGPLHSFCQQQGITVSCLLQVAWGIVLRIYTGNESVCFGYLASGRDILMKGARDVAGPLITLLVCRLSLKNDTPKLSSLLENQLSHSRSIEYQHFSLAEVMHSLGLSGQPLFNTAMSLQKSDNRVSANASDISMREIVGHDETEYSLTVNVVIADGAIHGDLTYSVDTMGDAQAELIADTFRHIVLQLINPRNVQLGQLDLLSEKNGSQILERNLNVPPTIARCIHTDIQKYSLEHPNASAVCSWDGSFTYGELDRISSSYAQNLLQEGVGPDVFVPICCGRSRWVVVAILAALKAGGAFILLDSGHPAERLERMVRDDFECPVIISDPSHVDIAGRIASKVVIVKDDERRWLDNSQLDLKQAPACPTNAAYAVFSSGSTGKPKATVIEHQSFRSAVEGHRGLLGFQQHSRVLQFASYAFDASIVEILTTLLVGGCVCIPCEADRQGRLGSVMEEFKVTWALLTPSVARVLNPQQMSSLKTLVLGGEGMSSDDVRRWSSYVHLINAYGPSECSVVATAQPSSQSLSMDASNIGRPAGSINWVVNPHDPSQLVPCGAVGELLIEGPIVGRGYVNRPELTDAAFLPYPPWMRAVRNFRQGLLYRTGDLVRQLSDASFRYIGRKDSQVKLHGQRIELGEVEHLVQHYFPEDNPMVFADMVTPRSIDSEYLVASIIPTPGFTDDAFEAAATKTRASLQGNVPAFLIPSAFILLREIPRLDNGKVDRRQLRQHASEALQIQIAQPEQARKARPVARLTAAEQQMQMLWCRVLGRSTESIRPDDNFFGLGGDSIAVMKLASVASTEGLVLAVSDIFLHPILRDLSMVLASAQQIQPGSPMVKSDRENAIVSVAPFSLLSVEQRDQARAQATLQCKISMDRIEDIYPGSALQAGLAAMTAERPGAYIAHHRLRLAPDVDLQRLKDAWYAVAANNPILRTRLIETLELGCLQVVIRDERLRWVNHESNDPQPFREMVFGHPLVQIAILPPEASGLHKTETDLILTMHHAIYDAWSLPRLLRDVQTAYRAPYSSCVEPAPFQRFIQYALWQKDQALEFWRGELENLTADPFPQLPSPSYRPRALKDAQCKIQLDHSLGRSVTISTVVQLAWAIVQSQYQSSDEVIFGFVSAGRTSPVRGIETMTGPTIATIPLRVVIDVDVTVYCALQKVQERTVRMVPFEQVGLHTIASLGPDAARACSFQTLINIEGREEIENLVANLEVLKPVDTTWENGSFNTYALQLTCRLKNDDMAIEASFDEHVVPAWQMQRILDQFCHVLHQVHRWPERILRDIVTINPRDIKMLANWNAAIPSLDTRTVLETIEFYFTERPLAIAVSSWDGSLTYRELDLYSCDLASRLVSHGVGPGTFVPIYLERSLWNVVAVVAVLKAKAPFILLETGFPVGRLRMICEEVRPAVIVTSAALAEKAGQLAPKIVHVGQRTEKGFTVIADTKRAHANAQDALYAVFTSGSTGRPKGAVVPNGSFVTMIVPYARAMDLKEGSRVLHFASYAFDVSVLELLGTLCVGACVCILSDFERRERLAPAIAKLLPSHAILTPSLSRALTPSEFPSVQKLGLIGEAVRASDIEQWQGHLQLLNTYGPAECTVVYTMQRAVSHSSPANIGHSIAGATWVTDPRDPQRLAPIGAIGELLLHGPLVGNGYLNNPDQTAAAFIPAPSWTKQVFPEQEELGACRMYRTGDLVRYEEDGSLSFVGRGDFQVKLRGQRFELGEVEALIQQHFPGEVRDVVAEVVTPISATNASCLVAFISLRATGDIGTMPPSVSLPLDVATPTDFADKVDSVKRQLEDVVPEYMVPTAFVPLQQMPRTMGGKIDRKQLRNAVTAVTQQQLESFAPGSRTKEPIISEAERTIQSIWARVLDLPRSKIGANDSFFRLGGDSISALQAVQEARSVGIEYSVGDLFNWRTIRKMAKRFAASHRPAQPTDDNVEAVYPCSPAQRGILLSQMRDSNSYAPHFIWKVHGDTSVDADRLAAAWRQVVVQQPALRTAFRPKLSTNDHFDQVIFRAVEPPLVLLHGVDSAEDSSVVPAVLDRGTATSVTRHDGYAVPHQLTICTDQNGDVFCRLDINHAVIDATSVSVLERDLCRAYDEASGVREPNGAYQNYIAFVQQQPPEPAHAYWKSYLEGIQPFTLPGARANTPGDNTADSIQLVEFTLPHRGSDIVSFCRGTDWTPSNLLYFAWALTLSVFSRARDVFFGTLTSGRLIPVPGIEEAVGQFSNMSVCRVHMTPDLSLDDIALNLQESYAHVLSYQTFPFVEIARAAGVSLDELASTAINVQYASQAGLPQKSSSIRLAEVKGVDPVLQDIMLYALFDQEGQLRVSMSYRPSYVSRALAKQLAEYFELAISAILQHPQATVGDLSLLSTRDRQRLRNWNGCIPDFRPNCIHELIHQRAREQPDSLAISGWDGELTYRELDDLASQLSVSLIEYGVATAQCIPLCFEKSRWTVVAMLAVMKASATFVPLDPSQPLNRLMDICYRTNSKLILSSPTQAALAESLGQHVMKVGEHIRNPNRNTIPPLFVDPEQPAYILFTSGSTGEPKGAIVPHSSYCYAAQTHVQAFSLDNTSRVLQVSSYAFDVSVMEILSTLVAGATVCVISEAEQSQMMTDGTWPVPVTHAFLTPSLAGSLDATKVPWLKTMVLLGEPLSTSHITQWGASCNLLNAYGPTECAVINAVSPRLSPRGNNDPRNIGWGLNVRCWIVDPQDHNKLVPVGTVGELVMNGPAVGLGYLGDERTTSDTFIESPAWLRALQPDRPQWRFYKTGDLVRYEISDGSLRFEGRKDRQIKVRGQRVELEDIEHHVRCCFPGVKEVVIDQVMIRQGQGQGPHGGTSTATAPRLVACIWRGLGNESNCVDGDVINSTTMNGSPGGTNRTQNLLLDPSPEFHAAAATALAQLREILPGYMVPDYFVPISKVPRTASGKTDRAQLCRCICAVTADDWRALQAVQRSQRRPLESATEEKLHSILVELLGIPSESVGADDSFFYLGGDSILAMKMAAKTSAEGMDISSHDILRYPTISEWAGIVEAHQTRLSSHETNAPYSLITDADRQGVLNFSCLAKEHPFTAENVEDIIPVVESQRFYVTHSSPVSMAELFPSGLNISQLRKACSETVAHHSILRTFFASSNGRYFQVILREVDPAFEVLQCEDPEEYMSQASRQKLEPSTALWSMPVSFTVVTGRARQDVVFILRISHAQYDGPSLSVLWHSIVAAYRGYALEKAVQFKDVVYHRLGGDHEEAFSFWRGYLQDALPEAWDPLNVTGISSSPENRANPTTVRQEIDQLGKLPGVTMATLVKAALAWSLSKRRACSDIILGQVVHGRGGTLPDMDKVLGPCINFLPIRIQIDPHWTVHDFLRHVQAQQLATLPHDFVSLNDIVQKCGTLENAMFGCVVHHQNVQATQPLELDHNVRSSASLSWANSNPTPGQVGVISIERGSSLDLLITAPAEAMDQSTAELLGNDLADTIRLFFNFPTCIMTHLGQTAHTTSESLFCDNEDLVANHHVI